MPRFRFGLGLAGLLLLGAPAALSAEDPAPAAPAPAGDPAARERAAKVFEGLPAPEEAGGFSFDGEFVINGAVMGEATLSLAAGLDGDALVWKALESVTLKLGPQTMAIRLESTLDRALTALKGRSLSEHPSEGRTLLEWQRTPEGYVCESQQDKEPATRAVLATADALKTSLSGLVAFCRALPAEPATYEVATFENEPNAGKSDINGRRKTSLLHVLGMQEWKAGSLTTQAWVVSTKEGERPPTLMAFEPTTPRRFLGLRRDQNSMEIRPKGATPQVAEVDFAAPALTARVAALQAARAFAVGDVEAVERLAHWPTVLPLLREQNPAWRESPDAAVKAEMLEGLRQRLVKRPPELIEAALKSTIDQLKEEPLDGGHVRVTFPEVFRSMVLEVLPVDGRWYLARFPEKR